MQKELTQHLVAVRSRMLAKSCRIIRIRTKTVHYLDGYELRRSEMGAFYNAAEKPLYKFRGHE